MTKLWIDDQRPLPSFYDVRASTVELAIAVMEDMRRTGEHFEVASFDYDAHATLPWTFEPVAFWMDRNDYWPDHLRVHTFNYWHGRPWLLDFFEKHAPESTTIDPIDPWLYMPHVPEMKRLDSAEAPEWVRQFVSEGVIIQ